MLQEAQPALESLERELRNLSHSRDALEKIQLFVKSLKNTKERQKVFNQVGALVQAPIFFDDLIEKYSRSKNMEEFTLLQGDIVQTDCAYLLGERIQGYNYVIASSTCDLVPGRRNYASLLRIEQLRKSDQNIKQILGELLSFKSSQRMYLPPLPTDPPDIAGNAVLLDGIIQIKSQDLLMSQRHASLTIVGWRILGSLLRDLLVRTGESEIEIREMVR